MLPPLPTAPRNIAECRLGVIATHPSKRLYSRREYSTPHSSPRCWDSVDAIRHLAASRDVDVAPCPDPAGMPRWASVPPIARDCAPRADILPAFLFHAGVDGQSSRKLVTLDDPAVISMLPLPGLLTHGAVNTAPFLSYPPYQRDFHSGVDLHVPLPKGCW